MHDETESRAVQSTVDRPIRGAGRNRPLSPGTDAADDGRLLPSLSAGITLLELDGTRGVPVVQSLVLDHLLGADGPAFWIDADGHATTTTLSRVAPSRRLLDRIHVARGSTAYQHYGAVCALPHAANGAVSLLVVPAVDARYRAEDTLAKRQASTLLSRTLARLRAYVERYDARVLVTRTERDAFTAPVERAADHDLTCERTGMGPRFVGEGFETLVYPVGDGAFYQTTFAYWRQLLTARAREVGLEPTAPPEPVEAARVGTAVTAGGDATTLGADPLADAWTGGSGPGGR